ncbi:interferon-induced protein with tetratricopeptide repeats 5 isoform X1 [Cuculus canorus]|uniref:interferon-induced protein with tetratricopeptide repeats 5 isoform X1 n=1 Tax=Cuculus canorus TaxID=55661 RepID=UPI0023AA225C|nr:interferon-induced protein with tetratricopeptide repeats 5 isoform X1 [Cuculus canorus]
MSSISKISLKHSLLQLQCHFTWNLRREDVDLDDLEETVGDQIKFFIESNSKNYNLLSYVHHLKNANEEALRSLKKAEEIVERNHPDEIARRSLVTWGNYAWIYYYMERYEEAQSYVSKVVNSCKKLSSTAQWTIQLPEIDAEKGWAFLKFGGIYYKRAKDCFEDALKGDPNNPEFNAGYAIAMYRLENYFHRECEDASLSFKPLKRAVELNPGDTSIVALFALKLQDLNQADEGERYIEEAMQKTPDLPYFLRYAAKFYRRRGDTDKALEIVKKALSVTPNSAFLHHQLALCYRAKLFQLKKSTRYPPQDQVEELIQRAIFHFKKVTDKRPKLYVAHTDLAKMYAEAKRYEEAKAAFQKAFQINNMPDSDKQQCYYYYGNFQRFQMKSESEAIQCYIEALKIENDSYLFHKCRTTLKKLLEQRIQGGSRNATDFGTLGFIHNLNGEKHEAIECYEKAVELCPNNEEYLSALCELQLSVSR